jgi:hypothetical protein
LPPSVEVEQTAHSDLMMILSGVYLITVVTPLYLILVTCLKGNSKGTAAVREALKSQLDSVAKRGFAVKTLLSDGEGASAKLEPELNQRGVNLNPSGPGQHVPLVEKTIRQVKERVRAHIASLPFSLNSTLLVWLVLFSVSRINLMPRSVRMDRHSPRDAFTGRKLDYNLDLRVSFGEYFQCTTPNIAYKNEVQVSRTEEAIALLPTGNLSGTVIMYNIHTGKTMKRDQMVSLPMPTAVVEHFNKLADDPKLKVPHDLVFKRGDAVIEGVDDGEDVLLADELVDNLEPA